MSCGSRANMKMIYYFCANFHSWYDKKWRQILTRDSIKRPFTTDVLKTLPIFLLSPKFLSFVKNSIQKILWTINRELAKNGKTLFRTWVDFLLCAEFQIWFCSFVRSFASLTFAKHLKFHIWIQFQRNRDKKSLFIAIYKCW